MATATAIQQREAVVPYRINKDLLPSDLLPRIYDDLQAQNLLPELLHEEHMEKDAFVQFLEKDVMLSVFIDLHENRYTGLGWLTDIAQTSTHLRAFGAYCFLRGYWDMKTSLIYGKLLVSQWFNPELFGIPYPRLDLLCGLTPRPNRLSRLWSTRIGMKYVAVLPGFTTYHGERVDAMICQMTRDEFNTKWGIDGKENDGSNHRSGT